MFNFGVVNLGFNKSFEEILFSGTKVATQLSGSV